MYPLYIRLTFDRRSTEYKSNLFDLFMKPKYGIRVSGQVYPPSIEKIIQREEKLERIRVEQAAKDAANATREAKKLSKRAKGTKAAKSNC